jgi:hypothetical protein
MRLNPDSFPHNNPDKSNNVLKAGKMRVFYRLFLPPELLLSGIIPFGKRMNAIGIIR